MNFSKAYAPEMFASVDPTRRAMTHVHLDVVAKTLTACNGHAMIVIPCVVEDDDTTGPVPVAAIKMARKLSGKRDSVVTVHVNGSIVLSDGTTMPRPDCGAYPDVAHVIPREEHFSQGKTASFDWRYMADAQKALGGNSLNMQLNDVLLAPAMAKDGAGAFVVIMPVRA